MLRNTIHLLIFEVTNAALKKYRHAFSDKTQSLSGFTGMKNYFTQNRTWGAGWIGFGTTQALHEAALTLVFSSH